MTTSKESSHVYLLALQRLNQYFREYNEYRAEEASTKILHFTSRQFCNFANLLKFYQKGPTGAHVVPEQFDELCHNVESLKDLKLTCIGDYISELQRFRSLEHLHITGPFLRAVKGLRSTSANMKSLIVENGVITVDEILSLCCMDESRPMSWPCLISLKLTNCSLATLDSSLKLLPNLQELDLSFNRLTTAGSELCSLDQLTHLNLAFNRIREVPQFNGPIRWQLQYLYLSYNELAALDGLHVLENLLELDLSHNILLKHDILQPLRYLGLLQKLDLRGNPLFFNSNHRKLSLRCISPQALKPDFVFDGDSLTNQDLEVGQYTPNAVPAAPLRFAARQLASINNLEPETYDVSMSSTADASGQQTEGDSYFKLCSQNLQKRKYASRTVHRIEDSFRDDGELVLQPEPTGRENFSRDEYSIVSEIPNDTRPPSISSSGTSVSDGLLESDHDDADQGGTGDYLTLEATTKTTNVNAAESLDSSCHSVVDSENGSSMQDLPTIETSATTLDELDMSHSVVAPMRASRLSTRCSDRFASVEAEISLTLTHTHLVETDVRSGMLLEKLELGSILNVAMREKRVLDVKFSYVKPDRRNRCYAFDENEALEDLDKLFGELDSVSLHNTKSHHDDFTCLKCSRKFSTANTVLNDERRRNAAMVCHCGSDLVVHNDSQANEKKLFYLTGDDDEQCQEALESGMVKDEQSILASTEATAQSIPNYASLSWIHTVHSVPDATRVFGRSRAAQGSDESHLSESLPNDLSSVSLQPQYSKLRSTASASVVNSSHQLGTPSKTFSHLLAPHPDLYKLVNVTSSMAVARSKNVTDISVEPMSKSKFENCSPEHTPRPSKIDGEPAGDLSSAQRHRQVMVTSTPRRRMALSQHAMGNRGHNIPDGTSSKMEIPQRRRALAFEESGENMATHEHESDKCIEHVQLKANKQVAVGSSLKRFIDEELLEVEEELASVFQSGVLHHAGNLFGNLPSVGGSGRKGGLFKPPRSLVQVLDSQSLSKLNHEFAALLVLSTANIHILEVTKHEEFAMPENLKCLATHPLSEIVAVDIGLTGCSLFAAFGSLPEKKKKFSLEDISSVYVFLFRDRARCSRFFQHCTELVLSNERGFSRKDSGSKLTETDASAEFSSPFSDFLEKSFSEDVLMHLDLNMKDAKNVTEGMLGNELFSYNPCWILDRKTGSEVAVAVVISCGGSLCIVVEDVIQVLREFVAAVVQTKRDENTGDFGSDSFSSSDAAHYRIGISQSAIQGRFGTQYTYESLTKCSSLENVVRFSDQPECVRLNFKASEV